MILRWTFRAEYPAWHAQAMSFHFLDFPLKTRCAQKTVTFHLDFESEIIEKARYAMQTLHSMENLRLANEANRWTKEKLKSVTHR